MFRLELTMDRDKPESNIAQLTLYIYIYIYEN